MHEVAEDLATVLKWIHAGLSGPPELQPIVGVSDAELKKLGRLGALVRERFSEHTPHVLISALANASTIEISDATRSAFNRLLEADPVVRLASLYAAIVKPANRRALGTFFTPRDSAMAIIDGYSERYAAPREVVDVGAGVGIFSEVAHLKWPTATIHAVDVNPVTLALQAIAGAQRPDSNVQLELADYRSWLSTSVPSRATLYLGNPPYTRWQLLRPSDRGDLIEAAGGLVGARANLSTLFLAMTLAKLRHSDSLAMIIPAGWMRADYGKRLRAHIRSAKSRRVHLRLADSWRFDSAIVDAVLVEIGPETSTTQPIEVSDWSGSECLNVDREGHDDPFPAPGRTHLTSRPKESTAARLRDFAEVTRGTATGANIFFVKSAVTWQELGLPSEYRHPLARRLRPGAGAMPLLEQSELLALDGYVRGTNARVDEWIDAGEGSGFHEGHLCGARRDWFNLSAEIKTPDVIVSALARDTFHVLPNDAGLAITNNLFGLYWKPTVDEGMRLQVVGWLRSAEGQAALRASSSIEANGLHRLSPRMMGTIEVQVLSQTLQLGKTSTTAASVKERHS